MSSNMTVTADPLADFPQIAVDNTLGAWLLGVAGSLLLNGMLFQQSFRYYRLYSSDRTLLKVWVAAVLLLETFTTVLTLHTAYFYLISKYWDPTYFFVQPTVWSINLLPIPGSIAALASQSFFARRVWLISPKFRLLVLLAIVLISGNVGCFTALSVKMFRSTGLTGWLAFSWLATLGSCIQMSGDMMLTGTLIYVLRQSRTGIKKTDSLLDLLITYAVSTGVITCVVHILNVAFSIKYPDNFIYAALSCVLTKLYANTFLVALNTRKSMGFYGGSLEPSSALAGRQGHTGPMNMPVTTSVSHPTAIELKVVTEVMTEIDEEDAIADHRKTKRGMRRDRDRDTTTTDSSMV